MKAHEIAERFRLLFAADGLFAGLTCHTEQTAEPVNRAGGALVFACDTRPLNDAGTALTYALTVWVESRAERPDDTAPDPAAVHAARVELVRVKLLGTGRAPLLAALNAAGWFSFRGWSARESQPALEGNHFRTPVAIAGAVLVL